MFQNLQIIKIQYGIKTKAALLRLLVMLDKANYIFIAFDIETNVLLNPNP